MQAGPREWSARALWAVGLQATVLGKIAGVFQRCLGADLRAGLGAMRKGLTRISLEKKIVFSPLLL